MNNDYLWDKSGKDFEIERLEGLFTDLRYQPMPPPALPQKELVFEVKRPWWRLSPVYTFAGVIVATILVGVWVSAPLNENPVSVQMHELAADTHKTVDQQTTLTKVPDVPDTTQVTPTANETVKTIFVPERKRPAKRIVPAKAVINSTKQPLESLTSEEKYAYEQLKLALAITGSKLKSVSDTINRTED